MKTVPARIVLVAAVSVLPAAAQQQTFTGKISDSECGASHQAKAAAASLTDRQCVVACIKALSRYVLVDQNDEVIPIANQDAMGLPFYAGRPVKLTGERNADGIVVTKIEPVRNSGTRN